MRAVDFLEFIEHCLSVVWRPHCTTPSTNSESDFLLTNFVCRSNIHQFQPLPAQMLNLKFSQSQIVTAAMNRPPITEDSHRESETIEFLVVNPRSETKFTICCRENQNIRSRIRSIATNILSDFTNQHCIWIRVDDALHWIQGGLINGKTVAL